MTCDRRFYDEVEETEGVGGGIDDKYAEYVAQRVVR